MALDFCTYWLAKHGNAPEEYEDAAAGDAGLGRFAVADGATESSFAGLWAKLLVEGFVRNAECSPGDWAGSLPPLQREWLAQVGNRELPWYAEAKLEQGAFATFLGVVLTARADGHYRWHAVAIGDACLFHTRGRTLVDAFPIRKSDQFGNTPWLIGSRTPPGQVCGEAVGRKRGETRPGDRLWLMTDALAQWFLKQHENRSSPCQELENLSAEPEKPNPLDAWAGQLRSAGNLRNDDMTLVAIRT